MKNKNLLGIIENEPFLPMGEAKGNELPQLQVVWQKSGVINRNGRMYPKSVLEKAIEQIQPLIKDKKILGASFHPRQPQADDISHRWDKVWMEEDGVCRGIISILPTSKGKNLLTLLQNATLGISSRGHGTTSKKSQVIDGKNVDYEEVNSDFKLQSPGDIVISPSTPGTEVSLAEEVQLLEESINEGYTKKHRIQQPDKIKHWYAEAVLGGFEGNFQSWRQNVLPVILEEDDKQKKRIQEQADETLVKFKQNGQSRERLLFHEAKISGFAGDFESWKKEVLPLLGMKVDDEKTKKLELYREAQAGGYKKSFAEWEDEVLPLLD